MASVTNCKGKANSHERKHNACRADIGDCVIGYTYINRLETPRNVRRGSVVQCSQAHAGTCPQKPGTSLCLKADRLVTGALKLLLLAVCMCLSP